MFQVLFLDQCYPMETEASKFCIASRSTFHIAHQNSANLIYLMSSQMASNIENILFGARSINSNLQHCLGVSLSFFVTPTNLVLIIGKKLMVLFVLSVIIDLKNQEKNRKKKQISVFTEFHASLTKKPKPSDACYLRSLYSYPCFLNILS